MSSFVSFSEYLREGIHITLLSVSAVIVFILIFVAAAYHFLVMQGRKIGGIVMEPVPDRVGYFEYKFSPHYWRTQAEFMLLVNSFNQDDILGMLQRCVFYEEYKRHNKIHTFKLWESLVDWLP